MGDNSLIIMENESGVADQIADYLKDSFTVHKSSSDDDAINIMNQSPVQLVLIGQGATDLQGSGFIPKLKDDYPEVTRALIAPKENGKEAEEFVNNGAVHAILYKPVDQGELDKIVSYGVRNYEKMDEIKKRIIQSNKDIIGKVKTVVAQAKDSESQKMQLAKDLDMSKKELGTALAEKNRYEKKLKQFQANWNKVIQGKG